MAMRTRICLTPLQPYARTPCAKPRLHYESVRAAAIFYGSDIFKAVGEVGPHAPDASYCRLSCDNSPSRA